jgi:hypothetical protein
LRLLALRQKSLSKWSDKMWRNGEIEASLNFKSKALVQNYHLLLPFHELEPVKVKSLTDKTGLHDNIGRLIAVTIVTKVGWLGRLRQRSPLSGLSHRRPANCLWRIFRNDLMGVLPKFMPLLRNSSKCPDGQ